MISWQFSQFVLFLQTAALLATHLLGYGYTGYCNGLRSPLTLSFWPCFSYIPGVVLHDIVCSTMAGAVLVSLAMFVNTMVLTSLFLCFGLSIVLLQHARCVCAARSSLARLTLAVLLGPPSAGYRWKVERVSYRSLGTRRRCWVAYGLVYAV